MQRYKNGRIVIQEGDITKCSVDAIVNAANASLTPGGGVDGAIHRAAGPELAAACRELGGCEPGQAKVTPGFALAAPWVIHAVGPVWQGGGRGEDELLASCYENALRLALENEARTVAFPAISTGVYKFPKQRAAQIAVSSVLDFQEQHPSIEQVVFCCYSPEDLAIYQMAADEYL